MNIAPVGTADGGGGRPNFLYSVADYAIVAAARSTETEYFRLPELPGRNGSGEEVQLAMPNAASVAPLNTLCNSGRE